MKNGMLRKTLALALTLAMLLACLPVQATEKAYGGDDITIDHDVKEETVAPGPATAVEVEAGGGDASMTVKGDVSATVEADAGETADAAGEQPAADDQVNA